MEGLFLAMAALLLVGLGTWAAFVLMTKMGADITVRWIVSILVFIGLLVIANRYIGLF